MVNIGAAQDMTSLVRDGNIILFKGNSYSVPISLCKSGDRVGLRETEGMLLIFDLSTKRIVAKHVVSNKQGVLVRNNNHYRNYSEKIPDLYTRVLALLNNTPAAERFLASLRQNHSRHIRDHLYAIEKAVRQYSPQVVESAINYCLQQNVYKAVFLKDRLAIDNDNGCNDDPVKVHSGMQVLVESRNIEYYEKILNGGKKNVNSSKGSV